MRKKCLKICVEKAMQKTFENRQQKLSKMDAKTIQKPSKKRCEHETNF